MNEECVAGVYDSLKQAEQAVHILQRADFPAGQVSLIASGPLDKPELLQELGMGDDSLRDAAIGAGFGSVLGVLVGFGAVVVSGVGAIFAFGPIAGGLTGAAMGAYLGGLTGWGVHRQQIRHYEHCIQEGKILVIAHGGPLELADAERIVKETDAAEVHLHARTSSESREVVGR